MVTWILFVGPNIMKEGTGGRGGSITSWQSGCRKKDREETGTRYHQERALLIFLQLSPTLWSSQK